jgi:glycosyltransferase involved in cell wall biosynthesis
MMISVIIPTLNEEKNLPIVLKDIKEFFRKNRHKHEIIIVDGHSKDRTVKIARKFRTKILYDDKSKGSALIKGFGHAKGDIIITMDADCSHVALEFGLLIEGIKAGFDVCMGSRFIQGGGTEDMPWYRKFGNKFFAWLVNLFWDTNYSDLCYGYKSFRKDAVKKLNLNSVGFAIETEMAIKAAKKKMRILEVPSYEKKRRYGKGKLKTFRDGFVILKTILREAVHSY